MSAQFTTPTRQGDRSSSNMQREVTSPTLQRGASSSSSVTAHRRSSSSTLARISSPSELLKKMSPSKKKMNPQLRDALDLLKLQDLEALKSKFLKLDAFLRPWSNFRDNFLLLLPGSALRESEPGQVTRRDIMYWYTLFDEGEKRYDPNPKKENGLTTDLSKYGVVDKSTWGVAEYEKLLYVWLLQTFKVGKSKNPYGFEYFECRSICSAWEHVLVPIVNAVRNDYNSKGRYHYGQLAKFVEEACHSRLAFPESNIPNTVAKGSKVDSRELEGVMDPKTGFIRPLEDVYDEDEKELRTTYPQYGQLVERPKVKKSLQEWVQDLKAVKERKLALEQLEKGYSTPNSPSDTASQPRRKTSERLFDKKLLAAREESKKRQSRSSNISQQRGNTSSYALESPLPILENEGLSSVLSSVRLSNPFAENTRAGYADRVVTNPSEPVHSAFGQSSGVDQLGPDIATLRKPSYEGTAYGRPYLDVQQEPKSRDRGRPSRIPSPIEIPPNETTRRYHPIVERAVAMAETFPLTNEPPPAIPAKNPLRYTSPRGHVRIPPHFQATPQGVGSLGPRIVSKENIRAALDLSMESSDEDTREDAPRENVSPGVRSAFAGIGGRGMNTGESPRVQAFNTHMFPRVPRHESQGGTRQGSNEGTELYQIRKFEQEDPIAE